VAAYTSVTTVRGQFEIGGGLADPDDAAGVVPSEHE
jgi:hypothetical protein